ncbi:MAG: GNAT family N-acetyltransferase, partial [Planctomycetota bacterium]
MVAISPAKVPGFFDEMVFGQSSCDTTARSETSQLRYDVLSAKHARQIAQLHIEGINRGFISSLGIDFVTALYEAIAEDDSCFGIISENEEVLGFVAFATDINKLYKSIIRKRGLRFAFLLATKMISFKRIKRVFETLFYPSKVKDDEMNLPSAELLSIVIAPKARRSRQATQLIQKGFDHCHNHGINRVKVMVAADNAPANKLYQKCGFEFAKEIDSHGVLSNIYTTETDALEIKKRREQQCLTLLDRLWRRQNSRCTPERL